MRYEFHLGKLITSSHALDAVSLKKRHRSIDGAFFMGEGARSAINGLTTCQILSLS